MIICFELYESLIWCAAIFLRQYSLSDRVSHIDVQLHVPARLYKFYSYTRGDRPNTSCEKQRHTSRLRRRSTNVMTS